MSDAPAAPDHPPAEEKKSESTAPASPPAPEANPPAESAPAAVPPAADPPVDAAVPATPSPAVGASAESAPSPAAIPAAEPTAPPPAETVAADMNLTEEKAEADPKLILRQIEKEAFMPPNPDEPPAAAAFVAEPEPASVFADTAMGPPEPTSPFITPAMRQLEQLIRRVKSEYPPR